MRYVLAAIRFVLLSVVSLFYLIIGWVMYIFTFGNTTITFKLVGFWGKTCLWLLNVKVDYAGHRPPKKVIIMPNHRSYIDIFLVLGYSPASIVAKKELGKWPVIGQGTQLARMILVDRTKLSSATTTMQKIAAEINRGGRVILFPEGTTFEGLLTKKFKSGSFKIAYETHTPIVPVAIHYTDKNDAWVGNDLFLPHFFRQMGKWTTYVQLWYGSPIQPIETRALLTQTQQIIDNQLKLFSSSKK